MNRREAQMSQDDGTNKFIPIPNMDPRMLAIFMILASQEGYVVDLLPLDGSEPPYNDPTRNHFKKFGLDEDIQKRFYTFFSRSDKIQPELEQDLKDLAKMTSQRDVHRQLFAIVARSLRRNEPLYHPPACPNEDVLKSVVELLNGLQAVIDDTLVRYGLT